MRSSNPASLAAWLAIAILPACAMAQTGAACAPLPATKIAQLRRAVEKNLTAASRAIDRVHTEGTLPHQGIWDQSIEAEKDWPLMRQLAQLWQAEHRPEDAAALSRLLSDWARTYHPSFNPIDETNLDAYIDAYAIAREGLYPDAQALARQFIQQLGEGYLQQMERGFKPGDGRWVNNWNAHRVKLATLAAAVLDDPGLWNRAHQAFVAHLGRNIRADGSTLDFEERDALHYVVYDLEPLVRAAQVAQARGENWLTVPGQSGSSLAAALDWLAPYARGDQTHQEFVHSHVKFDAQRDAAGVPGYSGQWNPASSAQLFAMAGSLDSRYAALAQQLKPGSDVAPVCWPR